MGPRSSSQKIPQEVTEPEADKMLNALGKRGTKWKRKDSPLHPAAHRAFARLIKLHGPLLLSISPMSGEPVLTILPPELFEEVEGLMPAILSEEALASGPEAEG